MNRHARRFLLIPLIMAAAGLVTTEDAIAQRYYLDDPNTTTLVSNDSDTAVYEVTVPQDDLYGDTITAHFRTGTLSSTIDRGHKISFYIAGELPGHIPHSHSYTVGSSTVQDIGDLKSA